MESVGKQLKTKEEIEAYMSDMESLGMLDPSCQMCRNIFYPAVQDGRFISSVFAPSHKPSRYCESGKRPHCTCDRCF